MTRIKPVLLITILGLTWGLHFSLMRIAGESGMDLSGAVILVSIGNGVVLGVIALLRRKLPSTRTASIAYYVVCALVGYLAPFLLEFYSAPKIGAGMLTIVVCLTPVATVILALLMRADSVTPGKVAGITLGLFSVVPLLAWRSGAGLGDHDLALLAAFGVPAAYAAYHNIVAKFWPAGQDSWQVAAGEAAMLCVILVPVGLVTGAGQIPTMQWTGAEWTLVLMVLFSTVEIYLYFEIVRLSGAIFVSQANFITVPSGVLWGAALFGERHDAWTLFSVAALALSLALAARSGVDVRQRETEEST